MMGHHNLRCGFLLGGQFRTKAIIGFGCEGVPKPKHLDCIVSRYDFMLQLGKPLVFGVQFDRSYSIARRRN